MSNKTRIEKLEARVRPNTRIIVLLDGQYSEAGRPMSEAEWKALATNKAYSVILLHCVHDDSSQDLDQ